MTVNRAQILAWGATHRSALMQLRASMGREHCIAYARQLIVECSHVLRETEGAEIAVEELLAAADRFCLEDTPTAGAALAARPLPGPTQVDVEALRAQMENAFAVEEDIGPRPFLAAPAPAPRAWFLQGCIYALAGYGALRLLADAVAR